MMEEAGWMVMRLVAKVLKEMMPDVEMAAEAKMPILCSSR